MFVSLNDIVDTLKLHYYATDIEKDKLTFNAFIDYLLRNKEEAMTIKSENSQDRFVVVKTKDINMRVMATSQAGFNVVCQTGDFTLSFRKVKESSKNPCVKVEFRSEFLLRNGHIRAISIVNELIESFLKHYEIKVSEIHLAKDIQGYNFSILDFYRIKTLKKNKSIFYQDTNLFFNGLKFTGFSIGKGAEMLRIYNKSYEIEVKKDKAFIKYLSWDYKEDYNPGLTVWRIEFQLRREKLKELYTSFGLIDSLDSLLNSISSIWNYLIERFVMKNFNIKECQELQNGFKIKDDEIEILNQEAIKKRFQRKENHALWDFISTFKNKSIEAIQKIDDIKKPSVEYVKNAFKSVLSTFIKLKRGAFDSDELVNILLEAEKEQQLKDNISLVDKARLKCIDYANRLQDFFNHTGVDEMSFKNYQRELKTNLNTTFMLLDDNASNIETFKQFNKKLRVA